MKKKIGAFSAGQFSLGTLVEGRPGTTIFQNPGGGGGAGGGRIHRPGPAAPPGSQYSILVRVRLRARVGVRVRVGFKDSVGVQSGKKFLQVPLVPSERPWTPEAAAFDNSLLGGGPFGGGGGRRGGVVGVLGPAESGPPGMSAARVPRGGALVGTPTYIPQNDPHDALIIMNIHKWGKIF